MATEVTTRLIDDLAKKAGHRVEAVKTVSFGYDNANYTIDLSKQNAEAFWAAVKPFVEAATVAPARTGGKRKAAAPKDSTAATPKVAGTTKPKADKQRTDAIREWARRNSYAIGDRGRIPGEVVEAYEAAGSPDLEAVEAMPIPQSAVNSVAVSDTGTDDQQDPSQPPTEVVNQEPVVSQEAPQVDFATTG